MAESLERLTRHTATLQSIRGIVRTMKTMSAINALPYEQAAQAIDAYRDTVLDGFRALLHHAGRLPRAPERPMRQVIVAMGSDHGLCGNYNEVLAAEVIRHPAARDGARIICVGAQMADALAGEGLRAEVTLLPPATADGLGRLSGELVTRLEQSRGDGEIEVVLVYTQREAHGRQAAVSQRLLPLDDALLDDLARSPWRSRSLPQLGLPTPALLAVLIRNLLFATLYRAAAEALVTENAARLARMQQAEQSVDERLEVLLTEARLVRQSEITGELLDVIVGFEALKGRERRRRTAQQREAGRLCPPS
jgi:F-type H+-transporting ATPase subunit gamma